MIADRSIAIWPFTSSPDSAATDTLVVYYSRTGTTAQVAGTIADRLADPTVERVRPTTERSYPEWLLLSCVPGSHVDVEPVPTVLAAYDAVFLGTPKWTLSCPPVTEYLARGDLEGARVGLFLTYGGFDEERYLRGLVDRLEAGGADVPATLRVKREQVGTDRCADGVQTFCAAVADAVH